MEKAPKTEKKKTIFEQDRREQEYIKTNYQPSKTDYFKASTYTQVFLDSKRR
jgi:hypothetical protein